MIQQFHSWLFLQRKQKRSFEKRDTLQCLLKHCLQQPRHGSNLNVHQQTQMDGADVVFICNGILLSRKKKRVKSCHLQQYGGIQVKDKYDKYDFTYMHNLKSRTN